MNNEYEFWCKFLHQGFLIYPIIEIEGTTLNLLPDWQIMKLLHKSLFGVNVVQISS